MKREFLKGLNIEGLTDEVIEKIMKENGSDIETAKTKADKSQEIENLKSELKSKDELIANTNSEMEKFKTMDIEGIKNKVLELEGKNKEYETQLSTSKETYEKEIASQAYNFKLKETIGGLKFPNKLTEEAFYEKLKAKNLPVENDKFLGFEDYVKEIGEQNPGMFVVEEAPQANTPSYEFAASTSGQVAQESTNAFGFNFNPIHKLK